MCGITGAVGCIAPAMHLAVKSMQHHMAHRGPDGEGTWYPGNDGNGFGVVLSHRRLAVIDLTEHGAQPMRDERTGNVICYNGEVYNFREIRRDLEAAGVPFLSRSDTEVVLKAYGEWGLESVSRLRGMFAIAIWDARSRHLHLIRDRVGIKPLYYTLVEDRGRKTLLFASELRGLMASGLVDLRIDPAGVASYVWNGFVVGPGTILKNVQLLPAGTLMSIDPAHPCDAIPERYWQLPVPTPGTVPSRAVDELESQLTESVKMRLISDVPLGVFLSGGIDSSAITALASTHSVSPLHTFTIGFEESQYDESRIATAVAGALGTHHTCIRLGEDDFRGQLDAALKGLDQPSFDAINTYFVSRAVRDAGMTVALAGVGGDELFGGYRSFQDIPLSVRWARRLAWMSDESLRAVAGLVMWAKDRSSRARGSFKAQTRWGKLADALCARGDLVNTYQVAYSLFTQEFANDIVPGGNGADVFACYGLSHDRSEELRRLMSTTNRESILHQISSLEISNFVGERLLRDVDAASMAVSLEVRVPLLDHEVLSASAAVDERARYSPIGRKQLLRRLALKGLDPTLFDRPKSGFVLPIDSWCRRSLSGRVEETLTDSAACQSVGLDPRAATRLWSAFQSGHPGVYWSRIWAIFVLLNWCSEHEVSM